MCPDKSRLFNVLSEAVAGQITSASLVESLLQKSPDMVVLQDAVIALQEAALKVERVWLAVQRHRGEHGC